MPSWDSYSLRLSFGPSKKRDHGSSCVGFSLLWSFRKLAWSWESHRGITQGRGKTWVCGLVQLLPLCRPQSPYLWNGLGNSSLKLTERKVAEVYMVLGGGKEANWIKAALPLSLSNSVLGKHMVQLLYIAFGQNGPPCVSGGKRLIFRHRTSGCGPAQLCSCFVTSGYSHYLLETWFWFWKMGQ